MLARSLTTTQTVPVLYTFRRCPYAMRARMALAYAGVDYELREVALRNKPRTMLDISAKGTVPVLLLGGGLGAGPDASDQVIDESLGILMWALQQADPQGWLAYADVELHAMSALVQRNDGEFKMHLDHYKYADRFPDLDPAHERAKGEQFLRSLDAQLAAGKWLFGARLSYADIALLPFVRQFVNVDPMWFAASGYRGLQRWLQTLLDSALFKSVMAKYKPWQAGDAPLYFSSRNHADGPDTSLLF